VSPEIGAALGGRTLTDIEALRPDLALLGVCAIDPVAGAAAFDPEDAEIKRALLRNSGRVAAAILNEKLETTAPFAIGRAESLDRVVLEADAPESVALAFADRGIAVLRAPP
jgi:DeoR/GlpR family transcriptional regulator of sugar metabolism